MKKKTKIIIFVLLLILLSSIATLSFAQNDAYNAKEIYALNANAVFKINVYTQGDTHRGTGFFISSDGIAVTAYHVIESFENLMATDIVLNDGQRFGIKELLYIDEENDIAVFLIKNTNGQIFPYLEINTVDTIAIDDKVVTIGYMQNNQRNRLGKGKVLDSMSNVKVSADKNTKSRSKNAFLVNIAMHPADSGGPAFNDRNQVIGIMHSQLIYNDGHIEGTITPTTLIEYIIKELNI